MAVSMNRGEMSTLAALVVAAAGLRFSPLSVQHGIQQAVRDSAAPAQKLVASAATDLNERFQRWLSLRGDAAAVRPTDMDERLRLRQRVRELEALLVEAKEENQSLRATASAPWIGGPSVSLIATDLVSAVVMGEENAGWCRSGKLLDSGSSENVEESSLVLNDPRRMVDQGAETGVREGQSVFAGRCIVGRIARAGRWVSTLQGIADPEFRGLARLVRGEGEDLTYGSEGLLEGAGEGQCRLMHVPATEAVSEGDRVYSAGHDALTAGPMFYGTVIRAELPSAASHWEIVVRPAVEWKQVRAVQILRKRIASERLLGQ